MILSIDFGGTRTKIGVVDDKKVLFSEIVQSTPSMPYEHWVPLLYETILSHVRKNEIQWDSIQGMVWAIPLVVDPGLKKANKEFGKFSDMTSPDFVPFTEKIFGKSLLLENDARAATLGEAHYGAGIGYADLGMITLGTGIGSGVIMDGKPLRGRTGRAGNMDGLSIMDIHRVDAEDWKKGILESNVATWAISSIIRKDEAFSSSLLSSSDLIDYAQIFRLASDGDTLAIKYRDFAIHAWSSLAFNMINNYDLECILFGGGIMKSKDFIIPAIRDYLSPRLDRPVQILASKLDEDAALLGNVIIWKMSQA